MTENNYSDYDLAVEKYAGEFNAKAGKKWRNKYAQVVKVGSQPGSSYLLIGKRGEQDPSKVKMYNVGIAPSASGESLTFTPVDNSMKPIGKTKTEGPDPGLSVPVLGAIGAGAAGALGFGVKAAGKLAKRRMFGI